jgi:hypothetical protein
MRMRPVSRKRKHKKDGKFGTFPVGMRTAAGLARATGKRFGERRGYVRSWEDDGLVRGGGGVGLGNRRGDARCGDRAYSGSLASGFAFPSLHGCFSSTLPFPLKNTPLPTSPGGIVNGLLSESRWGDRRIPGNLESEFSWRDHPEIG